MADLIGATARSWRLVKASIAVLNSDGELLALPLLSAVASAVFGGALVWSAYTHGTFSGMEDGKASFADMQSFYLWLFGFYIVEYFIIIFFNTALVGAAIVRLDGGDPTVRSALALAFRRIGPILGYAIISATVGILLRILSERLGFIGRLFGAAAGIAWAVATFLVVPVMAAENIGPIDAIEKSSALLRKTWGENLVGNGGIGIVLGLISLLPALAFAGGFALWDSQETLALVIIAVSAILLGAIALLGAAVSAVYAASVYYFAAIGKPPEGIDSDLIRSAFGPKDARA